MAGLGRGERERDALGVAQLADHHHVGVLAQGRAQRARERARVAAHLALVDQAVLERVHELDRVLHRDHVVVARLVEQVDERGERRGLARARRPAHDHQPLVVVGDLGEVRRQPDLGRGGRPLGDHAEDTVHALLVDEHVRAVAARGRDVVAEVELALRLHALPLRLAQDLAHHRLGLLGGERLALGAHQVGGQPDHRRLAHRQVEVGGAVVARRDQHRVELGLVRGRLGGERRLPERVLVGELGLLARGHLQRDLERARAHRPRGVRLRDIPHEVQHLRVLEVAERLDHLDPHLGRRVLEQLRQRRRRAQVADAPERLDRAPARLGIGERIHQRLDAARVLEPAERLGCGDADPPVGVLEQLDRGGDDARVLERLRHQHRRAAHFLVGVGEQLDRRLDQVVAEGAHRLERAIARPAREALGEHDVAAHDGAPVGHAHQDLEHHRARRRVAGGDERQDPVGERGALARGRPRQGLDQHLLRRVVDERELLDEQVDRAARVVLREHGERPLAQRLVGVAGEPLPARQALGVGRLRGEPGQERDSLLDAARARELPEQRLERRRHGRVEQQPACDLLALALALYRDLCETPLGPRHCEREESRRRRAHRGFGLAARLADHGISGFRVGQALQDRQHRVAVGAVRAEQHPGQVLGLQLLGRRELREKLVPLLAGLEGLVGKALEDEARVLGRQSHAAAV